MKSYFSIKPGATFFLGSSRTLVYHKDDVEIIYKTKTPSGKTYYAHVYLMLGGENSGLGMDIENVDYRNLAPTYLPFHPLVEIALRKFLDANNDLYLELNSHCPLKLWKDRLVAVWGQETL